MLATRFARSLMQATRTSAVRSVSVFSPADAPIMPLVITTALTGNVPTRSMNPSVPVTSDQMIKDIEDCYNAGSQLFHIHSRDEEEMPTQDLDLFRDTVRGVKERCPEAIVQLSTGARAGGSWADRWDILRLLPEMASFCTGSNNLAKMIYANPPAFVLKLAQVFKETGVVPEIECFDHGHIDNAIHLINKGLLKAPLHFDFVMGTAGGVGGTVFNMAHMAASIPAGCTWVVAGIGPKQWKLIPAAIAMGGHVRVGLEDNIFSADGKTLSSNLEQVERVVRIAKDIGRPIATPDEAREILNLPQENKNRIIEYLDSNKELFPITVVE